MNDQSLEVQLARLDERLQHISENQKSEQEFKRWIREQLTEITTNQGNLNNRMSTLEQSFAKNAPTIEEFITIKHKVVGAGVVGKWIWAILGGLIGTLFAMRADLIALITWFRGG